MFEFFCTARKVEDFKINPQYWAEKVVAYSNKPLEYSEEYLKEQLQEYLENFIEDEVTYRLDDSDEDEYNAQRIKLNDFKKKIEDELGETIYAYLSDGPTRAYDAINSFKVYEEEEDEPASDFEFFAYGKPNKPELTGRVFEIIDFWEWDCRDYNFRFIWNLYAIVWGISQYIEYKKKCTVKYAISAAH